MARDRALENAREIALGHDPRRSARAVPTFAEALETVIDIHAANWKDRKGSEHQWRATLGTYAFPRIGDKTVDTVTTADVMAILSPIWSAKRVTAMRVRQRIGAVMKWAVAQGLRMDNPAGDAISAALPKHTAIQKHQRALPHAEVAAALRRVQRCDAYRGIRLAFEFLVLTATRSGEARNASWDEIDCASAVWTIPAERMKNGREHRVPLSDRALEVLEEARGLADADGWAFPSPTGRALHQSTLSGLMHDLDIAAVPHGFRSSFPGLGRRAHRDAARGLRTRPGARQQRPRRGGLPAHGPVRSPPRPDGGLGRLRRLADPGPLTAVVRAEAGSGAGRASGSAGAHL